MPLRARRAGSGGWGMAVGDPTNECGRGNGGRGDCSALEGFKVSAELCIKYTYNKKGKGVVARLRGCSEDGREEGQKLWAGGSAPPGVSPSPPPKSWRSRTRAPAVLSPPPKKKRKKRKGEPLWGTHPTCSGARCGWGDGSAPPFILSPFTCRCPTRPGASPAGGVGPSAAGAAGRGGCGWR